MALTADETRRFVQTGDVKVHYHEAGTRPVLIFIHGGVRNIL
jgi:2-hydroxy-6-oxonona-2,4-dienedioate hydrolase/4,5:9,10-diseco-3-hydroxy-5,9,17-trioxoandrosta-1(10),2-diene-4-oate hydrolase